MNETLSQYLDRVMKQKGLKPRDVQERCGIAESYVRRILNGKVTNLTIETVGTLAEGLGLDPVELFVAGYGKPLEAKAGIDALLLADTIQKLVVNPELLYVVQEWVRLLPEHQMTFLQAFKLVNRQKRKAQEPRRR